jgi:hypothetical protein
MPLFLITVIQISEHLEKDDDLIDNPAGEYPWDAENSEMALDEFHRTIPIGCLDDFEVDIQELGACAL